MNNPQVHSCRPDGGAQPVQWLHIERTLGSAELERVCGGRLKVAPTLAEDRPQRPKAAAQQLGRQRGLMEGDERGP